MSRGIPEVKLWQITLEDRRRFHVTAPTKLLATLNLRADPNNWGSIKSIGIIRKHKVSGHAMVSLIIDCCE